MRGMIAVVSDNVKAYYFDAATQKLRVLFHSGGLYEYSNIDQAIASAFNQPHPWRRVGRIVIRHPTRKIH